MRQEAGAADVYTDATDDNPSGAQTLARDLSAALADKQEAESQLGLILAVIENLPVGVCVMDADFRITSVNNAYVKIANIPKAEMLGARPPFEDLMREAEDTFDAAWQAIHHSGEWSGEFWAVNNAGHRVALNIYINGIIDAGGALTQYAAVISDVTQRKKDEEHIRYQANFDALTGLPNRTLFVDRLHQSLAAMSRAKKKLGLMFIDLDGFKLINDTLGHDKGDDLLREAATRIADCTRDGDTVARLGGDEFTVIMPNLNTPADATVVAQRILDALSAPFDLGGTESFISGSIGITMFPDDAPDSSGLLKNADAAMYRAKESGKANYQFYTSDMNAEVTERLRVKTGLVKALDRGEFQLFFQPKLSLSSGKIEGVEALMRWHNADLGTVSPARFIPVLEETGQVVEVGEWALRVACAQQKAWQEAGLGSLRVAVNLSARQLREISFVSVLNDLLNETGVPASALEIEITESMLMSDSSTAIDALNDLHDLGIHVAMDDFGTGYSSLSYLRRFPIDTIKIDQSFVADITDSKDDAEIIRTIINMGRTLGRLTVAEGVETASQLDLLREYGCDQVQGYFLSPPLPGNELTGLIRETNT